MQVVRARLVALVAAILLFAGAGLVHEPLHKQREELQLTTNPDAFQNLPPSIAFTQVALGSFRGLIVDYLWARADQLQQGSQYHEALQHAEWITLLQPRFAQVWSFQAHNLGYNICASTPVPAERWQWVKTGMSLLRDRGIPLNPTSLSLYNSLSNFLSHKIEGDTDPAHFYYKDQFAREWSEIVEPPSSGASAKDLHSYLISVAEAAQDDLELVQQRAGMQDLVQQLAKLKKAGSGLGEEGLGENTLRQLVRWKRNQLEPNSELSSIFAQFSADQLNALQLSLTRRVLMEQFKMDPLFMADCVREFGPLDWRHPLSHSLYWISLGVTRRLMHKVDVRLPKITSGEPLSDEDLKLYREIYRQVVVRVSLRELATAGKITYLEKQDYFLRTPQLEFFSSFDRSLLQGNEFKMLHQSSKGVDKDSLEVELRQFLIVLEARYFFEGPESANQYLQTLKKRLREGLLGSADSELLDQLDQALVDVLVGLRLGHAESAYEVLVVAEKLLFEGYNRGMGLIQLGGEANRVGRFFYGRCQELAFAVYNKGIKDFPPTPSELADFPSAQQLESYFLDRAYFPCASRYASPYQKSRVYLQLKPADRVRLLSSCRDILLYQSEKFSLDAEKLFPGISAGSK